MKKTFIVIIFIQLFQLKIFTQPFPYYEKKNKVEFMFRTYFALLF